MATGRNSDRLLALKKELEIKVEIRTHACDLVNPAERSSLVSLLNKFVPDLIVNNAGCGLYGQALAYDTKSQMDLMQLNANTSLELSLEGARTLYSKGRRGVIMNVSSVAGFFPFPNLSVYAASKTFVNAFSESFDWEMKEHGIRVLASCPGVVATNFRQRASSGELDHKGDGMNVMTADYAAEEIWGQILSKEPVRIFDWRYRAWQFLSRAVPSSILKTMLRKGMKTRNNSKDIILN